MKHCDILIIDDDFDDVSFLEWELYKAGLENLHYVHTAKDALQYLDDAYPNCIPKVIVTDLRLPGMTGAEFLTKLKAMERYKHIKVVIVSSASPQHYSDMLKELGHLDFFEKPNRPGGYNAIIESVKSKIDV